MKWFLFLFLFSTSAFGQSDSLVAVCRMCDSIRMCRNLNSFYGKLYEANRSQKASTVKIVQIGDSHVQMGHFSGGIEAELKKDHPSLTNVSFRFPYSLTGGYDPAGLKVETHGDWKGEKMVGSPSETHFALSGHALVLSATGEKTPYLNIRTGQPFDYLEVLIETNKDWHLSADSAKVKVRKIGDHLSVVTIRFSEKHRRARLYACSSEGAPQPLRVMGFRSEEPEDGMLFESYGSSGGKYSDYVRKCDYCPEQLEFAEPDLFIISLGTNDAFGTYPGASYYELVSSFIQRIKEQNPDVAILLTTQPDTYYKEQKPVSDSIVHAALLQIAVEYDCALWDLAAIMGGNNSIHWWFAEGLAGTDLLHFTPPGYALQAELLVEALRNGYAGYVRTRELRIEN
jgi:lysophospholipase L1-like esterase